MLKDNIAVMQTIPVTILSGFLGAGKSTLINDLLSDPQMADTAIVVNEFGDIGIDHELIRIDQRRMMVTTLGCICCNVRGDLIRILGGLMKRPERFDGILVETTGLANPPLSHRPSLSMMTCAGAQSSMPSSLSLTHTA